MASVCYKRLSLKVLHTQVAVHAGSASARKVHVWRPTTVTNCIRHKNLWRSVFATSYSRRIAAHACLDFRQKAKYCTVSTEDDDIEVGAAEEKDADLDDWFDTCLYEYMDVPLSGHKVLVIQPDIKGGPKRHFGIDINLKLEESCALIHTLNNWEVTEKRIYTVRDPEIKYLFGSGKLEEVSNEINTVRHRITAVYINMDYLKTTQVINLQKLWKLPVFDRYMIVLQIFREHARTREAKIQIALAEIPYLRDKITMLKDARYIEHMGRTSYSHGGNSESILQVQQQILKEREIKLRRALAKIEKRCNMLRANRQKKQIPMIAVVGYTNCGKTTLIKALTDDNDMEPKNQLFATLDVTSHGGKLTNDISVFYIDTVGFISDIPTSLISAFSVTLRDAIEADLVIHVRDISHPDTEMQRKTVLMTLTDMLTKQQMEDIIEVCNKTDLVTSESIDKSDSESLYISAVTGLGISQLQDRIIEKILKSTGRVQKKVRIPSNGKHLSWLYRQAAVQSVTVDGDGDHYVVDVILNQSVYEQFKSLFKKKRSR